MIAVVISGLTLWNNWSERSDREVAQTAEAQRASVRVGTLVLTATSSGSDELILKPTSPDQSVQSQSIAFPTALDLPPAHTTGEPRIEADWFERALKKARNAAHLPNDSRGDERLPVVVTTRFLVDGEPHESVALYDIGYSISGHWLGGHSVTLRGISLVASLKSGSVQARLDARWNKLLPEERPDQTN